MKNLRFSVMVVVVLLTLVGWAGTAVAAPIDDLIATAKKEGTLELYAPSTLTPKGAKTLSKAFNKKYGLNIKVEYSPSGNMVRDVGKVAGQAATGVPPEWDVMAVTDAHHARLWLRKLHQIYDYKKIGVNPKAIHYDSGSVAFVNQFDLPAYNKKFLPAKDVPKSWDDLLDPKWKGGKIGVHTATHHFARLAVGAWGEEKAMKYVKALAQQKPILGRLGEMYQRLLTGEILISATLTNSHIFRAHKKGAPLTFAEEVEPVISPQYHLGVLKNAKHPNAGFLFTAFNTSLEAQKIWESFNGLTSAFVPGTSGYKYVQGKKMLYMTQDQAKDVDRLSKEYGKILGFRKKSKKK